MKYNPNKDQGPPVKKRIKDTAVERRDALRKGYPTPKGIISEKDMDDQMIPGKAREYLKKAGDSVRTMGSAARRKRR